MDLLLDLGADVNLKNYENLTVLHLAIDNRMTYVIEFLIDHGANLNVCDIFGDSLVHYIIKRESSRANKIINSESTVPGLRTLYRSLLPEDENGKRSTDFFRWMLSKGVNLNCKRKWSNCNGDNALHHALKERNACLAIEIMKYSNNIDARDYYGNTALNIIMHYDDDWWYAYGNGDEKLVAALLSKGADIHKLNNKYLSPLTKAVDNLHLNFLKMFAEHGANFCHPYSNGNLFHYLFRSNRLTDTETYNAIFDLFMDQGCDVNAKDSKGTTPIHLAVRRYQPKIVKKLLRLGVNVNSRSDCGYTLLHEAVEYNNINVVFMLIKEGVDVNARTQKGQLALHLIKSQYVNIMVVPQEYRGDINLVEDQQINIAKYMVNILIDYGCDINAKDADGFMPLHSAILRKDQWLMKELLRFGADINDSTYRLDVEDYIKVFDRINEHLVKLRVAKQPIDERLTLDSLHALGCHKKEELEERCFNEIEELKSYKITNFMSLYGFLHLNRNTTCAYVKNEKLKEFISSQVLEQKFPLYQMLISSRYYMAVYREKILELSKQALLMLTDVKIPDLCMHEILNYLSNVDLRLMIEGIWMNDTCDA